MIDRDSKLACYGTAVIVLAVVFAACQPASKPETVPSPSPSAPIAAAATPSPLAPVIPETGGFVEHAVESGIDFRMSFLPTEQGEKFKINFYDHGTAVAVADIDGDGDDDLYFVNQLGSNALYSNDGRGQFTNVTAKAGVGLGDRISVNAVFADYDNDGDQDLYVTSTRGGSVLFQNDGTGIFQDVTKQAGLELVMHTQSSTFFDFDGDGNLDLFVSNTAKWTLEKRDPSDRYYEGQLSLLQLVNSPIEANVMYRNDGNGHFTDVTGPLGLGGRGWSGDTAVFDYDGDGRPDLYVANMFGGSILYRNRPDGKFEDVTTKVLGRTSWGAVGAKLIDYDRDGLLDLYVVDMHSDMWTRPRTLPSDVEPAAKFEGPEGPWERLGVSQAQRDEMRRQLRVENVKDFVFGNTLMHNLGSGRFEEVSEKVGVETFWPWSIGVGDYDGNGYEDVFLSSGMGYPFWYWPPSLLMNQGGRFVDEVQKYGLEPPPGGPLYEETMGGKPSSKSSRAVAVADFDQDGRQDIVVGNFNGRPFLYFNRLPKKNYVAFRLTGSKSNRDAIGAILKVKAGGATFVRQVQGSGGYLQQSSRTLHVGLGDLAAIESCEIVWPSGTQQSIPVESVRLGAVNDIVEPKG